MKSIRDSFKLEALEPRLLSSAAPALSGLRPRIQIEALSTCRCGIPAS